MPTATPRNPAEKPPDLNEYQRWLKDELRIELSSRHQSHYDVVTNRIKSDLESSQLWLKLCRHIRESHDKYLIATGYPLLISADLSSPFLVKPYPSFLLKTYRHNILENANWPSAPPNGWLLPDNWYSRINDTVRTLITVKYLDGVQWLIDGITEFCNDHSVGCSASLEARTEGYYAAHVYVRREVEVPRMTWDTEKIQVSVEVQITTQLQEVIRRLLHRYYEAARTQMNRKERANWQWDYRSEEFSAAYLGHILHYVEGMILEIRSRQQKKERLR